MIKAILSTLLVFCLFGHQAFAVAQFETEAPEPVGSEFQDVVFHLDGFFSEELSILSDKEVQIAELYVISESNEQFLIQNHVTRFANEHTVDIDGRGLSHIVAKVRARDYAGANLKLVSKQIHQLPKASFDFAYTPHSEHTWNIKSLKQNMTADRLTLKNVGARGKVYELYVNYGGEEPGTIVYLSKDQSLNPQLSRTVLSTGKELVVTLDGTRPIESVFFRGDSHVSGQDTVMEVSFQTDEIKMPGPTASFDFVRFRAPHTNHTWNLSQAKFKSPTLSATGSVSGRITVMVVNYADGTSDDLVAQAREDNNHIEPKNGRLDVRLNETQGMTINLKLDPEKYIESVEMTADSWKSGSSLVLDLELDPINELVHTYMVEQGNREVSKWELDPDANTSSVKSISINALDADVTVQDFKVNFSSGRSQNILAAGNETFLRLAGEQRVRTYQITSREAVSSVEVTASTGSPSPVRLRVSLNQGELAPLKDFCKDKLGRIHRSNTGELWRVQIEDAVSNRCTAGGVDNYYFRQWQNQFCESGAVRNAQIDVEQTHYNSDGASCVPTVTSPNPAPAACTANVQGRDARMFYSQQFWSDDQSLDPAGNRLPIEDRLVSVEKSCPWDEGGRDYYFKTYLHECGSDSDGDGKGEIRLVSRDQEQRGRRYGEHIACPAPRDCTKADHGFTWQELLGSIDTEEEPCRFDDGVIRKSYEEIIIHTCENGDIKAGSSVETRKDFPRSQCYVDPDGSGYCDPNASCDPRPSGFPMYADFRPRQRRSCDATVFDQLELDESQSNDRISVFSQTLTACDRQEYTLELVVSNEDANTRSYWWGRTGFMNTQTPVQRVRCTDRFGRDCRGEWSVQVDTPQPRNCRVEGESGNLVRPGGQLGRALVEAQANNRLRVPGGREALVVKRSRENLCDKEVQVVNVSCGLKGLEEISELRWETREGGSNPEDPSCSSAD